MRIPVFFLFGLIFFVVFTACSVEMPVIDPDDDFYQEGIAAYIQDFNGNPLPGAAMSVTVDGETFSDIAERDGFALVIIPERINRQSIATITFRADGYLQHEMYVEVAPMLNRKPDTVMLVKE